MFNKDEIKETPVWDALRAFSKFGIRKMRHDNHIQYISHGVIKQ
jgi:hypothetical protein